MRNSKIILASNILIDKEYKNVLDYTETQMLELVNANKTAELDDCQFIRDTGEILVDISYNVCLNSNYIAFQNPDYSNKWFFAWIDKVTYKGEKSTTIKYTIDVWSTWFKNSIRKKCFVLREHVNDDTLGLHTLPENLETGEYIVDGYTYYDGLDTLKYVIQCTEWATQGDNKPLATNFGGVYMAGGAYVCSNITEVVNILQAFASAGKSDAVYNVYMIPSAMINTTQGQLQYAGQSSPNILTTNITKTSSIDGYTPKNKKVLTFPYRYMLMSNNSGSSNILHYERFGGDTCNFIIKGVPTVGGSIKIYPTNYDRNNNAEEEGLIAGKFPTLNWSTDEYTNWLTQNSVNIALGVASSGLTIIGGLGMMSTGAGAVAGASATVSGALSIANELGAIYQHSLQPNSAKGNVNGGDINVCSSKNGFYFYHMSIKQEYAIIIDNFFTRFGYKINKLKQPDITSRTYWNYIQIGNTENWVYGGIPSDYIDKINNIARIGTTIWHSHSNIGNFDLNNTIVSSN